MGDAVRIMRDVIAADAAYDRAAARVEAQPAYSDEFWS